MWCAWGSLKSVWSASFVSLKINSALTLEIELSELS